jgi:hypothetical protein
VKGPHVSFQPNDRRLNAKTDTWEVWSLDKANHLGTVEWYSRWRKYVFSPEHSTIFDEDCLRSIAVFLEWETRKHRNGKRSFHTDAEVPA